jgi:hypothetical protein
MDDPCGGDTATVTPAAYAAYSCRPLRTKISQPPHRRKAGWVAMACAVPGEQDAVRGRDGRLVAGAIADKAVLRLHLLLNLDQAELATDQHAALIARPSNMHGQSVNVPCTHQGPKRNAHRHDVAALDVKRGRHRVARGTRGDGVDYPIHYLDAAIGLRCRLWIALRRVSRCPGYRVRARGGRAHRTGLPDHTVALKRL